MAYTNIYAVTVDNTKVGGSSGSISNFSVLIRDTFDGTGGEPDLRTTANGGDVQNTDATGGASGSLTVPADFAFYADRYTGTQLDHEFVDYNAATGFVEVWVRVPTIQKASDTTFYLYYEDSGVTTSQENVGGTWGANYVGVWHLHETSSTRYDSSGNSNNLTDNNTVTSGTGQVGTAADFEKTNKEYLSIADASQTGLDVGGNFTIMGWFNLEQLPSTAGNIMVPICKDDISSRFFSLQLNSGGDEVQFFGFNGGSGYYVHTSSAFFVSGDVGNWVWMGLAIDVASQTNDLVYKNNSSQAFTRPQTAATSFGDSTAPFELGDRSVTGGSIRAYDGLMDEVKIYDGLLDADYFTTVYNNENSPTTFTSLAVSSFVDPPIVPSSSFMSTNTKFW